MIKESMKPQRIMMKIGENTKVQILAGSNRDIGLLIHTVRGDTFVALSEKDTDRLITAIGRVRG